MSLKEERFNLRIYGIDNRRSPLRDEQLSRCQLSLHHELNAKADISIHLIRWDRAAADGRQQLNQLW
ncbi:hypothetical protein F511_27786 [Dorcoceras hygrometricum]|uniref:Uncharacterized protein n=1 Tax=Dorcoceras hygrometricum TaxID=472368 RepID=A0A2Z7CJB3_9LAMI|nr:hypothetical protein F511_27786 [Dorcoceras hygrometricum]